MLLKPLESASPPSLEVMDFGSLSTQPQDYISTGLDDLDNAFGGGLPLGHVCVISGQSGAGKTALSTNLSYYMASEFQKATLFISMEMAADEILMRIMSEQTGFSPRWIRGILSSDTSFRAEVTRNYADSGFTMEEAKHAVGNHVEKLKEFRRDLNTQMVFNIADNSTPWVRKLRTLDPQDQADYFNQLNPIIRDSGYDVIVLDYFGRLAEGLGKDYHHPALETIAYDLGDMVHKHNKLAIVLSQVSDDGRDQRGSGQLKLRDAPNLKQTAQTVIYACDKKSMDSDEWEYRITVEIPKSRFGSQKEQYLRFIGPRTRFLNEPDSERGRQEHEQFYNWQQTLAC